MCFVGVLKFCYFDMFEFLLLIKKVKFIDVIGYGIVNKIFLKWKELFW